MDYIKIRFGNGFDQLSSEFEKTIQDMFRSVGPMFACSECTWHPQMDIYETPQEIIIRAEIAGVEKEDLDVEINRKAVKISGIRAEMPPSGNGTYRLAEIQYGEFERTLFLPAPIDTEKVTAAFSNGFLQIRLLKLPLDKIHRIPIADG